MGSGGFFAAGGVNSYHFVAPPQIFGVDLHNRSPTDKAFEILL